MTKLLWCEWQGNKGVPGNGPNAGRTITKAAIFGAVGRESWSIDGMRTAFENHYWIFAVYLHKM